MEYLFIGGSQDGKMLAIAPSHPTIQFEVQKLSSSALEEYTMRFFSGGSKQYVLYALKELNANDVMDRLFAGYRSIAYLNELQQKTEKEYEMARAVRLALLFDPAEGTR